MYFYPPRGVNRLPRWSISSFHSGWRIWLRGATAGETCPLGVWVSLACDLYGCCACQASFITSSTAAACPMSLVSQIQQLPRGHDVNVNLQMRVLCRSLHDFRALHSATSTQLLMAAGHDTLHHQLVYVRVHRRGCQLLRAPRILCTLHPLTIS